MRSAFAPLALAALASATPMPQASSSATADCSSSYDGEFMIQVVNVTSSAKRSVQKVGTLSTYLFTCLYTDFKHRGRIRS